MYTVRQKKEPIFFCVNLLQYFTETGDFFSHALGLRHALTILQRQ